MECEDLTVKNMREGAVKPTSRGDTSFQLERILHVQLDDARVG